MTEFVMTRSAQAKGNNCEKLETVTYIAPKKKTQTKDVVNDLKTINNGLNSSVDNFKREQELEMKKLRWDVMKFGSSGFEGRGKIKAKVALAIELGAKPPKNRRKNYKKLILERNEAKAAALKKEENISGLSNSLKKPMKSKKIRKNAGLLELYGKIEKKRRK